MNKPEFSEGAILALLLALACSLGYSLLPAMIGEPLALRVTLTLLGLGYVLYLLARSGEHAGRLATLLFWLLSSVLIWSLSPGIGLLIGSQLGLIWLTRVFFHHSGALSALLDLGLNALAALAAIWALRYAASPLLAAWSFFLVQALFVFIPGVRTTGSESADSRFRRAERSAQYALHKLSLD